MKKLIALLLAAVMLMGVGAACAETMIVEYDKGMDFTMDIPEQFEALTDVTDEGVLFVYMAGKDDNADVPSVLMLVAADDEHDETARLNDLTEDEKKAFAESLFEDDDEKNYEIKTSGHGTEAVVIETMGEGYDSLEISSIYHGYVFHVYYGYADGRDLTDADRELAMQLFTDLNVVIKE
ncbi:MAG: hypothetical protein Q4C54_01300 [Clostridia bacterium]|nr:hypothetical protein [Clostridia bacterium]